MTDQWQPARLLKRYKRFLADVELAGRVVTVHCPNPGAMTGLAEPGMTVWLAPVQSPTAKLPYRWVMSETQTSLVGVDTGLANGIAARALADCLIPAFAGATAVRPEVTVSAEARTRLDFCLDMADGSTVWLEVKSVTLSPAPGLAAFPDAPTLRGQKHLKTLMQLKADGHRAALLFVVQRSDCSRFCLADDVDAAYGALCRSAAVAGVEIMAWDCQLDPDNADIFLYRPLESTL